MDDGYTGPVLYVSYSPFPPRAKGILARPLAAIASGFSLRRTGRESASPRAGGGSLPTMFTVLQFRRPSWGNLAASEGK
jgi:hypothetical protein